MAKLKHKINNNLENFLCYVFGKTGSEEHLQMLNEMLLKKTTRYKILHKLSKSYGGNFITKNFSKNHSISDFTDD